MPQVIHHSTLKPKHGSWHSADSSRMKKEAGEEWELVVIVTEGGGPHGARVAVVQQVLTLTQPDSVGNCDWSHFSACCLGHPGMPGKHQELNSFLGKLGDISPAWAIIRLPRSPGVHQVSQSSLLIKRLAQEVRTGGPATALLTAYLTDHIRMEGV